MKLPDRWTKITVGEVVDFQGGTQPPKSTFTYEPTPGYVRMIQTRDFRTDKYVTYIPERLAKNHCQADDVLIGRYGPPVFQIFRGLSGAYNVALIKAVPDESRITKSFLHLILLQDKLFKLIDGLSRRSAGQAGVDMPTVRSFPLFLPPLSDQCAITCLVDVWNRCILQLNELIAVKVRFKQGMMQQILSGQRRFKGLETREIKWSKLSNFLTLTARPTARPNVAYKALGLRCHGKGTFVRFVEDPKQVQMDTLFQVKKDDLIVNITFAWEGAVAIVSEQDEQSLVSHRFPTFVFDHSKALPEYLRQVVITPWFIFKMGLVSPGGAGRNRVLNKTDFLKIEIPLPDIDEQSRISRFLGAADREIDLLREQLENVKQQKKGLMQKLLTGEIRVKIPHQSEKNGSKL